MNSSIRNIHLVAVIVVLVSTIIAFFLEMKEMYENKDITLADLLLMFIYIEVIGLVRSYWETQSVRITYPLIIAITEFFLTKEPSLFFNINLTLSVFLYSTKLAMYSKASSCVYISLLS